VRWLLLPLLLVMLIAPSSTCERQGFLRDAQGKYVVPPLSFGHPLAFWGTDLAGRDLGCLVSRGSRRSLELGLSILALGVLPGILIGLLVGARGRTLGLAGEIFVLGGLLLVLGTGAYRLVLAFGVTLYLARAVSAQVASLMLEPYLDGARALGGGTWHIVRVHLLPHVLPRLPALVASSLGVLLLWTAELGALGFYDLGGIALDFGGADRARDRVFIPREPDLAQLVAFFRFSWLAAPEQLFFPAVALVAFNLGLTDLGRWLERHAATKHSVLSDKTSAKI
jgi:ABC-type dipeptide/oligopeptide/nickel transport system permease subunit